MSRPRRLSSRLPALYVVLAWGLLICSTAACGRSGGTATSGEAAMPWSIDTRAVIDPYQPRNGVNVPPAGMRYAAIELEVRNESESTQLIEPAVELRLATLGGTTFEPAELLEEPGDISFGGPNLGKLGPRQALEGIIIFEVPIGDAPRSLMFYWGGSVLEADIEAKAVPSQTSQ